MTEAVEIYLKFVLRYLTAVFMRGKNKIIADEIKAAQNGYKEVLPMQRRTGNKNVDKIEEIFRRERELSDAVLESKIGTQGHTGGTPTGHSYISDPTAISALRRAVELETVSLKDGTRIFKPEKWLEVIHAVKDWCAKDTLKDEVYKRRYLRRESYVATCSDIHIVQQTYSLLLWDIRNFALQCAAQAQLIRVY